MAVTTSQRGFSLVELMVAIAILAIGMSAVGAMLYATHSADRNSAGMRRAEALAMQLTERFKAGNIGATSDSDPCKVQLLNTPGTEFRAGFKWPEDKCWNPSRVTGAQYYCKWVTTVFKDKYGEETDYRQIDVRVYWDTEWQKKQASDKCTRDSLDKCPHRLRTINYYKQYTP